MSIKVMLHPVLNSGVETILDVEGNTVGDCMRCVIEQYPHIAEKILVTEDKLKNYVEILINGQSTFPKELMHPVKDGDSLAVLIFLTGG